MASYKLYLDLASIGEDGQAPVKIMLSNNHNNTRIDTGVTCPPVLWTGRDKRPIAERTKYARADNDRIEEIVRSYDNAIYELTRSGRIRTMRPADIRAYVDNKDLEYTSTMDFFSLASIIKEEKGSVTAGHIDDTIRWVRSFVGSRRTLPFEDITLKWLNEFTEHMATHSMQRGKKGLSRSTQGIILRNLKAIYNRAIVDGQATQSAYPFKGYKMPKSSVRKQFLMPEDIRKIRDADLDPTSRVAASRDYFMLSFYLCGTNLADIWKLGDYDAYIRYCRTKVEYKVDDEMCMRIQPEVQQILERRRGKLFMFDAQDHYITYESFYHSMKHGLDQLAKTLDISRLTYYMARYTWATYAGHENVPEYVIDRSLGHAPTSVAGKHYISYDWRKTDKANRLVLDYVASDRPWDEDVDW